MPRSFIAADGHGLGNWVATQRVRRAGMSSERAARLEALAGWTWDVLAEKWEEGFAHLKTYLERNGHARVVRGFKTSDGYPLGRWVNLQRTARAAMDSERVARLEALDGWVWDVYADLWEEGFGHLKEYVERNGHARVPQRFRAADGYPLAEWVRTQRRYRDDMSAERAARLEALAGWVWSAR